MILRGRRYNRAKKNVGRPPGKRGQSDHKKTAEALAAQYGVSDKTIRRDVAGGLAVGHTEVMAVGIAAMMETDHGSEAVQGG